MVRKNYYDRLVKNQKGIVFVTVLMIIIAMMIVTITVISLNIGQVITTEGEVQRLKATELATGLLYYTHGAVYAINPGAGALIINHAAETMDGITYTPQINVAAEGTGISGSSSRDVLIRVGY